MTVVTVGALWRFPVKSMAGERVASARLTRDGMTGDRAYALVDVRSGEVLTGRDRGAGARLMACRARFLDEPGASDRIPPTVITLPDGTEVRTDRVGADAVLGRFLGRSVAVCAGAGLAESNLSARETFLGRAGLAGAGRPGLLDLLPASLITTATLDELTRHHPTGAIDGRRFRMNVTVETPGTTGFIEDAWLGSRLRIGAVEMAVVLPTPRCVMTTIAQADLAAAPDVLRTVARHHRRAVAGGTYPCAGVSTTVLEGGTIQLGDTVRPHRSC